MVFCNLSYARENEGLWTGGGRASSYCNPPGGEGPLQPSRPTGLRRAPVAPAAMATAPVRGARTRWAAETSVRNGTPAGGAGLVPATPPLPHPPLSACTTTNYTAKAALPN